MPSDRCLKAKIGSGNGLVPNRCNDVIVAIRPQETYFSKILFKIPKFSFKKMR